MKTERIDFLRHLVDTPSPSAFEQGFQELIVAEMESLADEVRCDAYGNVIGTINPGGTPRIMLAGHADEIGLMVNYIDEQGYLYVSEIGAPRLDVLAGQRVTVHTADGPVHGLVMGKRPEKEDKDLKITGFWIDIAATDRQDAASVVSPSDPVTWDGRLEILRGDRSIARGLDDRIGVFIIVETLRCLAGRSIAPAVYGVSTVQEELGSCGARISAFGLEPDAGIAIDVTPTTDYPGTDKHEWGDIGLDRGPVLFRGANIHPVLGRMLIDFASSATIPYQLRGAPRTLSNDSSVMQVTRAGVPAATVGIPNRYMHTPTEMISLRDVEHAIDLLVGWLAGLDAQADFNPVRRGATP